MFPECLPCALAPCGALHAHHSWMLMAAPWGRIFIITPSFSWGMRPGENTLCCNTGSQPQQFLLHSHCAGKVAEVHYGLWLEGWPLVLSYQHNSGILLGSALTLSTTHLCSDPELISPPSINAISRPQLSPNHEPFYSSKLTWLCSSFCPSQDQAYQLTRFQVTVCKRTIGPYLQFMLSCLDHYGCQGYYLW